MSDDPKHPDELDDADEAKLIAEADEGEESLPEFADARDAGAGDVLADAGEGAHIEGIVRAGLMMVPEVTSDVDAADRRALDAEADRLAEQAAAPRRVRPEADDRVNP